MTLVTRIQEQLEGIDIRFKEPLKLYTYTKVGGRADYLVLPRNRYEMARVVQFANQESIPWMVLGNASNIIVRDGGIRGFVILCDKLNNISVDGYTIEAEAGANLIETTRIALRHSLTGFEFACGIRERRRCGLYECGCLWRRNCPYLAVLSNFDQGRGD